MMKNLKKLFALCVVCHLFIWEAASFLVPRSRRRNRQTPPNNFPPSTTKHHNRPAFSYFGYQNDVVSSTRTTTTTASTTTNSPYYKTAGAYTTNGRRSRSTNQSSLTPVRIDGGSLKTFSLTTPAIERVLLLVQTTDYPLHANIELWQGPDSSPQKIGIYSQEGTLFGTVIQTPGESNAIAIRNMCEFNQFPLDACMQVDMTQPGFGYSTSSANLDAVTQRLVDMSIPEIFSGGGNVREYYFPASVSSVQVLLETDGRPMNARIEVTQESGSNSFSNNSNSRINRSRNVNKVIDVSVEDGMERPFFAAMETPWATSTVVRVINAAPSDFRLSARVEPYVMDTNAVVEPYSSSWVRSNRNSAPFLRQVWSQLKSLLRMVALLVIGFESATHMTEIETLVLSPQAMVLYGKLEQVLSTVGTVLLIAWNQSSDVLGTILSAMWHQLESLLP